MLGSFFAPGGAANSGWTSCPPLSIMSATSGETWWLVGMICLITSALFGSINTIVTIVQLRAPGGRRQSPALAECARDRLLTVLSMALATILAPPVADACPICFGATHSVQNRPFIVSDQDYRAWLDGARAH